MGFSFWAGADSPVYLPARRQESQRSKDNTRQQDNHGECRLKVPIQIWNRTVLLKLNDAVSHEQGAGQKYAGTMLDLHRPGVYFSRPNCVSMKA